MPVVTHDSYLSVMLDGQEINCQIIDAKFKPPGYKAGNQIQTACPDGFVTDSGDAVPGSLTGTIFADASKAAQGGDHGITYSLAVLFEDQEAFPFTFTQYPGTDHEITYTGVATVSDFELTHARPGYAKQALSLEITSGVLTKRTAA